MRTPRLAARLAAGTVMLAAALATITALGHAHDRDGRAR